METPSEPSEANSKKDEQMARLAVLEELEELERDEHELFDDFMEMVVTFGYITLFGAAFVLGAPCIFVFILIEARSDIFRLEATCRRPMPGKTYHIGSWSVLLAGFCFFSVFSNIIISCYTTSQMDHLLPGFKEYREHPSTATTTVFCLEHALFLVIFGFKLFLDAEPAWIKLYLARRAHRAEAGVLEK